MLPSSDKFKHGKRRVPDSLRRRTLVSCDRCKIRRIRCFRANEHESCASCVNGGVKCESTLPRKQRVYGSVERLSLRYRALDALVKGLFPDDDTEDIDALFRLAKERRISMPSADDQAPAPDAFSQSPPNAPRFPLTATQDSFDTIDNQCEFPPSEVFEERMIPAPHGVSHYVGPASTFDFASTIRYLVARYNGTSHGLRTRDRDRSKLQDFANMTISKALEPRIRGHPAAAVSENSHESGRLPGPKQSDKQLYSILKPSTPIVSTKPPNSPLRDILPPKDLSDVLVRAFFDKVHPNYVIFHRGIFQLRYESLWHHNASQVHDPEIGWGCSLFMVLVLGAEVLGDGHSAQMIAIQTKYMKMVRERFENLAFTASLANVQALLLLQLYEHNSGERNTAWMFLGLAARMAMALGMHRENVNGGFDATEKNMRRMLWWTLYMFEQNLSIILGRPSNIDPKDVNTIVPNEANLDSGEYPPDYHAHALTLMEIATRVKRLVTVTAPRYSNEEALLPACAKVKQVLQDLQLWKSQLPQHLTPGWQFMIPRHRRPVYMLHAYYYHFKAVVTRPFLLCKVNRNIDRLLQADSAIVQAVSLQIESLSQECRSSAMQELDHLLQLSTFGLLEGVAWTDYYYAYHAMLVMSLDFLGRPRDVTTHSAEDLLHKSKILSIIDISRRSKLAPTYRILSKVAIDFAIIVGIASEESSSSPGGIHSNMIRNTSPPFQSVPYPSQCSPPAGGNATGSPPNLLISRPELIQWVYQYGTNEMPWDFFNLGMNSTGDFFSESSQQIPPQYSGSFGGMGLTNDQQPSNWLG